MNEIKAPTLSICMIVKDEEENLRRCLDSVRTITDELIVVDTGSTDRTPAIAKEYGAQVYEHAWADDFSLHRNQALSYATKDWIFQIDADEELCRDDIPVLRTVMHDAEEHNLTAIYVQILSLLPPDEYSPKGDRASYCLSLRLFKRGCTHYEDIVHNQVIIDKGKVGNIKSVLSERGERVPAKIRIFHYGYAVSPEKKDEKRQRTEKLLLTRIDSNPKDFAAWHYLIRQYRARDQFDKVIESATKLLTWFTPEEHLAVYLMILIDLSLAHNRINNDKQCEQLCLIGLHYDPLNLDLLFQYGMSLYNLKKYQESASVFLRWLQIRQLTEQRPNMKALVIDTWELHQQAEKFAGWALGRAEDWTKAAELMKTLNGHFVEKSLN